MRVFTPFVLALPALASGSFLKRNAYAEDVQPAALARPASTPASDSPVATASVGSDTLELRQAPAIVPANAATLANPSIAAPAAAVTPVASAVILTTTLTPSSSSTGTTTSTITSSINTNLGQPLDYTTTKWIETWVGGTYSTWTPTVITVIHKTPALAPPLWKGEIGMGSLTGETGKTQTVYMGAAPSEAAGWAKRVAAAVGVGIAGMVV